MGMQMGPLLSTYNLPFRLIGGPVSDTLGV